MSRRRIASLERVLAYRNEEVLARFCRMWRMPRAPARLVFADLMRFLWLSASGDSISPVPVVDEMWHAFLAYTVDYAEFCERYFGRMLHHAPTPLAEQRAWQRMVKRSPSRARASAAAKMEREVALVAARLGEAVMLRWYVAYAERYDSRFFQRAYHAGSFEGGRFPRALRARAGLA